MKKLIKITSLILILSMVLSVSASAFSWPELRKDGLDMPFMPKDKYVTDQNPPDFRWQYVEGAKSYKLVVSKNEDLSSPVYEKEGITTNYYNFDQTFEPGVTYWWGVKYTTDSKNWSEYSTARRFRMSPDAMEFTVPDIDTLLGRIPNSHPRILTTPDTLDEIRSFKNQSDYSLKAYNGQVNSANSYVTRLTSGALSLSEPAYNPPDTDDEAEFQQYQQSYRGTIQTSTNIASVLGFVYMLTEDGGSSKDDYANWGKKAVLEALKISMKKSGNTWVMDSSHPASYPGASSGQSFREITYKCAMAYDWLYDEFTEEERAEVLALLKIRTEKMLGVILNTEKVPYQSHGWTILGFLGIVGVATYGEIPEAEEWLRRILPLYTNMLPPWGYEDGGWSQGVDYWQWSSTTNQEIMNVLALGGIINLYDKSWAYKEHLWSLYVYPYGSYGSFGDGAGINKAGSSSFSNIANTAYFTKNPVARWIVESYGDAFGTSIDSYYAGMLINEPGKEPVDHSLGHEFDDVGWAVMTDSLVDTDRVQLTFKSSPFGSYNHVAAEQNAFFLQAYGQILAGKSGYYDSYHSPHHATISKATFAHNSITVDGAKGQSNANFNAKGDVSQFVSQMHFDSVTGDASKAYTGKNNISQNATPASAEGKLDKFIRSIIYIRPGVFVVVDDLDAYGDEKSSFEWWLNSPADIDYTSNTAYVKNGKAQMNVNVHYPSKIDAKYYKGFVNPIDGKEYLAGGSYETKLQHNRLRFATESVKETKMVTTMSVYKEGEEAVGVSSQVSGSCLKLTFDDGTICLVNLGDTTKEVSDGTVAFKGSAATYNDTSIMLTNGTSLSYGGASVVTSAYPMTIAIGDGQLAMSVTDDSNNGSNNTVTLRNNNKFISVASLDSLKDANGRSPSVETGFYPSRVSNSLIRLYPYKGNYNLFIEDAYVKPSQLVVENLAISKGDNKYYVRWKEVEGITYDISVNGTVYENVESPYLLGNSSGDNFYRVSVKGRTVSAEGKWSDEIYLSTNVKNTYSYVRYTPNGNKVTAEVFSPNFGREDVRFVLESYDGSTGESKKAYFTEEKGIYSAEADLSSAEGSYVKTYLWEGDNLKPLTPAATMNSSNTGLKGIYVNGTAMDDYSHTKNEYTLEASDYVFPAIKAVAADNSAKVSIVHNYGEMYSGIVVTSANGTKRNIKINYVFPEENLHFVNGALAEGDFKYDIDRSRDDSGNYSGKKSISSVGTLTWDLVYPSASGGEPNVVSKSSDLNVHTNLMAYMGGDKFGSRVASDRKTNVFNNSSFTNAPKEFWGYDHILFPNENFIDNVKAPSAGYTAAHVENAKFNITLNESAQLAILSSGEISALEDQGFEREALGVRSNGSYMVKKPDPEDVYYNIFLKGRDKSELTSYSVASNGTINYGYVKNFDLLEKWTDVNPVTGYTTLNDYADAGLTENKFTVKGTLTSLINQSYYVYNVIYTKNFDDITTPREINVNLGSFAGKAERMIAVIKPVTAKKPISNFKYLGALSFGDLTYEEALGNNDNYANKRNYSRLTTLPVMRTFKEGAVAYIDNTAYTIEDINPLLELEGAYFMPTHKYLNSDTEGDNWMKAYYYGMGNSGSYSYPGLKDKSHDLYSFDLNTSSKLYVITYGNTPEFIDNTWQRISLSKPAFTLSDAVYKYTDVYVKNIDVPRGESVNVTMKTPATGSDEDGVYYLLVKPN